VQQIADSPQGAAFGFAAPGGADTQNLAERHRALVIKQAVIPIVYMRSIARRFAASGSRIAFLCVW